VRCAPSSPSAASSNRSRNGPGRRRGTRAGPRPAAAGN
jgi:hypothetical protein